MRRATLDQADSIRDLYNKDIDELFTSPETSAYREAKDFMRMLMPSHAKSVKPYREHDAPLFAEVRRREPARCRCSRTQVTLKSGGYHRHQPDRGAGRDRHQLRALDQASTTSRTPLCKTNLEAAEEISRQLRLRDLAGLIVIDFIDMEENRNEPRGREAS
jgi:ribonuclease E